MNTKDNYDINRHKEIYTLVTRSMINNMYILSLLIFGMSLLLPLHLQSVTIYLMAFSLTICSLAILLGLCINLVSIENTFSKDDNYENLSKKGVPLTPLLVAVLHSAYTSVILISSYWMIKDGIPVYIDGFIKLYAIITLIFVGVASLAYFDKKTVDKYKLKISNEEIK